MRIVIPLLLLIATSGCSQQDLIQRFASPEDQSTAKNFVALLRRQDFDAIEGTADQSIKGPELRPALEKMAAVIPAGDPTSVKLVGAQSVRKADSYTAALTFEYNFGAKWFLIQVVLQRKGGIQTITGFHLTSMAQSLEATNRFTLVGKSAGQLVILAAALVAALFTFCVLVVCIRTKLLRWKWLWVLFIILGFGRLTVNWTTGQLLLSPLMIQLFSGAAFAQLYGPWSISVSIPLGAVIFLFYRTKHNRELLEEAQLLLKRPR